MKKILLSLMLFGAFASMNTAKAQCDLEFHNLSIVSSPGVQIGDGTATNPNRCQYFFDVEFDITTNSGFKYLFIHSWLLADYPAPAIFNCSGSTPAQDPGNVTQLGTTIFQQGKSIIDFGFIGLQDGAFPAGQEINVTSKIASAPNYPNNDNTSGTLVGLNTATNATVTRSTTNPDVLHFKITGLLVEKLGACEPIAVTTDIWGSNAQGAHLGTSKSKMSAQCYECGLRQSLNDPTVALVPLCGAPRQYSFSITSGQAAATVYNYSVYMHDPTPGSVEPDFLVTSGSVTLSTNGADAFPTAYSSGTLTIAQMPYCCISPWSEWDMRLDVTSPSFSNTISTGNLAVACATLPVNLKAFTAVRINSSTVNLKWETAQEENSKGFEVQRKLPNGAWQTIDFVESKTINGNSSSPLSYEFTDRNNSRGITQYRLRQLDMDGKQAISQIRAVRGEGQKSKTIIYPNPSGDGKVNIIFENLNSTRDVSVTDVSGRTIKQWKGITNNNIQIDNLSSGFYTVRIVNNETGEQTVEKFVVNKR